jgi:uncharacterized protein
VHPCFLYIIDELLIQVRSVIVFKDYTKTRDQGQYEPLFDLSTEQQETYNMAKKVVKTMSHQQFEQAAALYTEVDIKAVEFASASRLSCPIGCGLCCDKADTEVSVLEAEYIANYMVEAAPEIIQILIQRLAEEKESDSHGECVFYDRDSDFHCRIYPVRPLICRCYGYSAERDKIGSILFPACQHMDLPAGLRAGGGIIRLSFEPFPPVMQDYRIRLRELEVSEFPVRMRPLGQAVAMALE